MLLLTVAAAVAVLLAPAASAGDPTAASPTPGPGTVAFDGACAATADCSTAGATCVRRACRCPDEIPVLYPRGNRCLKGVALNDTCEVAEQCNWLHDLTDCVDNRCVCLYGLVEKSGPNGMSCGVDAPEAIRQLGEDCTAEGAVCGLGAECRDSQCQCHSDLTINNKQDMCGKAAKLGEFCRFDEQCSLKNTECRNNRCSCKEGRVPYPYVDGVIRCLERGEKKWGDQCNDTLQCGYDNALCAGAQRRVCDCHPDFPATNNLDKCDISRVINQSCTFNEQCEMEVPKTECRGGLCACRFGMTPQQTNGAWSCGSAPETPKQETHIDPAMIGVLVGMALMFIILCVVLRLFSKARWRENRTIFNTPNPRLMNVSLLRDSKLLHSGGERRGSRASVRAPSRQPSMASLRPQSPSQSLGQSKKQAMDKPSSLNSIAVSK